MPKMKRMKLIPVCTPRAQEHFLTPTDDRDIVSGSGIAIQRKVDIHHLRFGAEGGGGCILGSPKLITGTANYNVLFFAIHVAVFWCYSQ